MLLPLFVCEDEERHCFCLDVCILGYGIEAGAALFPFGRGVFAPDAAVSHYLCAREFLTEEDEQLAQ